MVELLSDIASYLRRPRLTSALGRPLQPLRLIVQLVVISLSAGVLSQLFSSMLITLNLVPEPGPHILDDDKVSIWFYLIGGVIIAPVIEECVFRWQLKKLSASLALVCLIPGALLAIIAGTQWMYLVCPVIFVPAYLALRWKLYGSVTKKFTFWKLIFPWHFHLTAVFFALVHLSNFEKGAGLLPYGIWYTLPQLCMGLILGYVRMYYGLRYGMAVHALYNLSFVTLLLTHC